MSLVGEGNKALFQRHDENVSTNGATTRCLLAYSLGGTRQDHRSIPNPNLSSIVGGCHRQKPRQRMEKQSSIVIDRTTVTTNRGTRTRGGWSRAHKQAIPDGYIRSAIPSHVLSDHSPIRRLPVLTHSVRKRA